MLPLRKIEPAIEPEQPVQPTISEERAPLQLLEGGAQRAQRETISEQAIVQTQKPPRLLSLDALRGLTIAMMLLVNNVALDAATPAQLRHAQWGQGITLADYVFPWFLFCVGVSVPFSAASYRRQNLPLWLYDLRAIFRACALVFLGCVLDSAINRQLTIGLGVLQIIGLAYLASAMLYELPLHRRLLLSAMLLGGYWGAIKFMPYPGGSAGVWTPESNLLKFLNDNLLTPVHLRGLLSVIPTTAMALIGSAVGDLLRSKELTPSRKTLSLFVSGAGLMILGFWWNKSLGYNKTYWTPSYILWMAGSATFALGALYAAIDLKGWKRWSVPLLVLGSNALLAYVAPILVKVLFLQRHKVQSEGQSITLIESILGFFTRTFGDVPGGWLYTLSYIAVCWLVLLFLYRRKLFLRV